nr:MAG TPA: hypothetical protein [Caudoviricetes sp.]
MGAFFDVKRFDRCFPARCKTNRKSYQNRS